MNKKSLGIWFVALGIVLLLGNNAQAGSGIINVVREDLPGAKILVTGKGYPPNKNLSSAQKHLLAKRAATIDAYRVLASTVNGVSDYIIGGSGVVQASGFVKGAEIYDVKYFANGKVEVDVVMPVSFLGNKKSEKINWDTVISNIAKKGYPVCYSEKPVKQISEDEWMDIHK
jgi:hypothetical protein